MQVDIREAAGNAPLERIYIGAILLKNFRGKPLVEVQLFRPNTDIKEVEKFKGKNLVGEADPLMPKELLAGATEEAALGCLLEAFTLEESRQLEEYLKTRYGEQIEKLSICPMNLPIPLGVGRLGALPEGDRSGFIHFDKAPGYSLPFPLKGYYDLE